MLRSKKWVSIVEAIVVVLILSFGLFWVFKIYISGNNLSVHTSNKNAAISIAKEWLEAVQNIRDTNWNMFSTDLKNCRNTLNYDKTCVLNTSFSGNIEAWNYVVTKATSGSNQNKWLLTKKTDTWDYKDSSYRSAFKVYKDTGWFYTQAPITPDPKINFTRRINIAYCTDATTCNSTTEKPRMKVTSIVEWQEPSREDPYKLEIDTVLTNYKGK